MTGLTLLELISPAAVVVMMLIGAYCGARRRWVLLGSCIVAWIIICLVLLRL